MSIKEFEYLDKVICDLNNEYDELNQISETLEILFSNLLKESDLELLNISSRVKSPDSLKEKFLEISIIKNMMTLIHFYIN